MQQQAWQCQVRIGRLSDCTFATTTRVASCCQQQQSRPIVVADQPVPLLVTLFAGCFSEAGDGWLWGFGTSNQLGKGDDDDGERQRECVRVAAKGSISRQGDAFAPPIPRGLYAGLRRTTTCCVCR